MEISAHTAPQNKRHDLLMEKAKQLEAAFLSEMLSHTGMDKAVEGLGGGDGAMQFASFLRNAQAEKMVDAGGIGLAEVIFKSMLNAEKDSK